MSNLVGIDLGTTFSAIAVLDEIGKPEIVPNADGERITASVVHFTEDEGDKSLVGDIAKKALVYRADRVVQCAKQRMGDDFKYSIEGTDYSPQQISSFILKKLAQDAALTKGAIENAVITVPANFRESARKATMDAGKLAGLEVTHIINEPTAAALYYATIGDVSGRVLIYDLGGGTFDVTVADVANKDVQVVASLGDAHLGGTDFDGGPGDYFLRNDKVEATILGITATPDFGVPIVAEALPGRGVIVDLGTLGDKNDQLTEIDTVVILMGMANLGEITAGLIEAGRAAHTPAISISSGCTVEQRIVRGRLGTIAERVVAAELCSPVLTLIGDVADLAPSSIEAESMAQFLHSNGDLWTTRPSGAGGNGERTARRQRD